MYNWKTTILMLFFNFTFLVLFRKLIVERFLIQKISSVIKPIAGSFLEDFFFIKYNFSIEIKIFLFC